MVYKKFNRKPYAAVAKNLPDFRDFVRFKYEHPKEVKDVYHMLRKSTV